MADLQADTRDGIYEVTYRDPFPAEPSFENTIEAYEFAGRNLYQLNAVFQRAAKAAEPPSVGPIVYRNMDEDTFFRRVRAVYDARNTLQLDQEQRMLLEKTYRTLVRQGALLDKEKKQALEDIEDALASYRNKFTHNVVSATDAYRKVIDREEDLAGVPERAKTFYKQSAEDAGMPNKWVITLSPHPWEILTHCDNRSLRKEIMQALDNVGCEEPCNNKPVILEIVRLRHKKAQLLGYANYAAYVAEGRMLSDTDTTMEFLHKSADLKQAAAENYARHLQDFAAETDGIAKLKSWDRAYYHRKLCEKLFGIDPEELRPYFELNRVVDGAFRHAEKLFNITFTEVNPDQNHRVFEVRDKKSGEMIGLFGGDYFSRPGKSKGAWACKLRARTVNEYGIKIPPVVENVFNFTHYSGGEKTFLSPDDVDTVFHELGHALHHFLAQRRYNSQSGTNVEADLVEVPSMLQENWTLQKEVLDSFARHDQTGKKLPTTLLKKAQAMRDFDREYRDLRQLYLSTLDMTWHMTDPDKISSVEELENNVRKKFPSLKETMARFSPNFLHIFSDKFNMGAGYVSYVWSRALSDDIFSIFKKKGLYAEEAAEALRTFYATGGSKPGAEQFQAVTGHTPDIQTLFRQEAKQITARKRALYTSTAAPRLLTRTNMKV